MSGLLLDTHVALWWLDDDPRIDGVTRSRIEGAAAVHVSAVSSWEIAIKSALGKLRWSEEVSFGDHCSRQGFQLLAVDHADAWAVRDLPPARTDPFDRLIAATARRRGLTIVTADPVFTGLDVGVLRVGGG